jgi:hypothetical protein
VTGPGSSGGSTIVLEAALMVGNVMGTLLFVFVFAAVIVARINNRGRRPKRRRRPR